MKKTVKSALEYLLAFLIIFLLLLAIASVVVVKFYGEDLKSYAIEVVNETLDTKITTGEITVRVFHKFPSTSIVVKDLTLYSSHNFDLGEFDRPGADTLLTARSASVSFNLFSMIIKRYKVRTLEIKEGELSLLTDSKGEGNYRLLRSSSSKKRESKGLTVDLNRLRIEDFSLRMENLAKELEVSATTVNLELNGRYARQNTQFKGSLRGRLELISNKGILYASRREVGIRTTMDFRDSLFSLRNTQVSLDRIVADMEGQLRILEEGIDLDLAADARNLEIHEVLDLLPAQMSKSMKEIRGNGNLQLSARIQGPVSTTLTPKIDATFETSNANLNWSRLPFSLKNLDLRGSYSNGGQFDPVTTALILESISATIGKDHFSGSVAIRNFYDPEFSLELEGDLHPGQWLQWYPGIPLAEAGGSLVTDIRMEGRYDRLKPRGSRFTEFDLNGGVTIEDLMLRIRKGGLAFEGLQGSVVIDNDLWKPVLSGTFGSSDFRIEGSGLNLISCFLKREDKLVASADFRSAHLDLQEILDELPQDKSGKRKAFKFPAGLDLKLDYIIRELVKDELRAENVRGSALYDSPFFYVDSLIMQGMGGTIRGSFGMVQDSQGNIFSTVEAGLLNLDIQDLFLAFNNFGQEQLTHEHLKGTISGSVAFAADFDSTFNILPESIRSRNDITIRNGELNDFTPILALSRFIEVEELRNIRFNTLENTILIRDSEVIIPSMDIRSNALDLSASGTHGFNDLYEYRLVMELSDLLYGKARQSRNSEFVIAEDESDTRTRFLVIYDRGQGAKVELDRQKAGEKIREDLREEKSELKRILNEELGLFKKQEDSLKQEAEQGEENLRFILDEDEKDSLDNRKIGIFGRKDRMRKTKTDTVQNKPATKFVIDE